MLETILMQAALSLGQPMPVVVAPPAATPAPMVAPAPGTFNGQSTPSTANGQPAPGAATGQSAPEAQPQAAEEPKKEEDKFLFMRSIEGTPTGEFFEKNKLFITGWVEGSYNGSSAAQNNAPVVWTDRANEPMLQQAWIRVGKALDKDIKEGVSFGFQVDAFYGSDYRFTLPRGFFNGQLQNADGQQNIYGFDSPQHYVSAYVPTIFEGTEFRVGRLYTPWGVESIEAVSTPLITRSYAFNYAPPFTHCGVGAYVTFSKELSGTFMVVNGNDVYFGDPSEDWRGVFAVKYDRCGKGEQTITFAGSVGRGAFNQGEPFFAPTAALPVEPFGRNNINVFDVVYTQKLGDKLNAAVEGIFGYQTNVPPEAAPGKSPGGPGNAYWASAAGYLFYTLTDETTVTTRLEAFNDFQGQRTGFEGQYFSATLGASYKPSPGLIFRTEARYDHNIETNPFEGDQGIFVLAADIIFRY